MYTHVNINSYGPTTTERIIFYQPVLVFRGLIICFFFTGHSLEYNTCIYSSRNLRDTLFNFHHRRPPVSGNAIINHLWGWRDSSRHGPLVSDPGNFPSSPCSTLGIPNYYSNSPTVRDKIIPTPTGRAHNIPIHGYRLLYWVDTYA